MPVVGAEEVRYSRALVAWHNPSCRISEQYRDLRIHLTAYYKDKPFALIVTSAQSGEGKTVTCLNLAFAMAEHRDLRTVVVDCDFRRNGFAGLLHDETATGLADVLRGKRELGDVIRPTPLANLSVVLAGKASREEACELISRPELDDVVRYLRRRYEHVIFDTPPANTLCDAGAVGRIAGEALLVVRMNRTRRESVTEAIRHFQAVNVNVAGLVLTGQKYFIPKYLYRYS
ncbi:MAG: tyrosine-protein kinase family protein [Planctomycetota bacterium]|jgi:capsular exopolysaccharide synthesis family protein